MHMRKIALFIVIIVLVGIVVNAIANSFRPNDASNISNDYGYEYSDYQVDDYQEIASPYSECMETAYTNEDKNACAEMLLSGY
jgi:hypothetical protein